MPRQGVPNEVKKQVENIVKKFNETKIKDPNLFYAPRYKGKFLYLDRKEYEQTKYVCRLGYTGNVNDWDFAIYKYSKGRYDGNEWFFPGSEYVDGTLQGAMKAGLEAYP